MHGDFRPSRTTTPWTGWKSYIDAPDGTVAVAAAEITAAAQGNPHRDLPEDDATWVTAHGAELACR